MDSAMILSRTHSKYIYRQTCFKGNIMYCYELPFEEFASQHPWPFRQVANVDELNVALQLDHGHSIDSAASAMKAG